MIEGKDESSSCSGITRIYLSRPHEIVYGEICFIGIYFGRVRMRINRFESNPKLTYLGQIFLFRTLNQSAYSSNIIFIEKPAIVIEFKSIGIESKSHRSGTCVFSILQQLINKMS